jgi:hypothetical protein
VSGAVAGDNNSVARRIGRGAVACALSAVAVLGLSGPAMASTHNVMVIGYTIPPSTKRIMVSVRSGSRCLTVTPGADRNTGLSVRNGGYLVYQLFDHTSCSGTPSRSKGVNVPGQLSTTNFWLSVA